jgi:hypothetical protein
MWCGAGEGGAAGDGRVKPGHDGKGGKAGGAGVSGEPGAVWAAIAAGQDVDTAISAQSQYTRQ